MFGLVISAAALYFALRNVHWSGVRQAARDANYFLIAAAVLLLAVSLVLRAYRWRVLFHPITGLRIYHLFGALNVAYLVNNILPFNVGELARAYVLSEVEGVSATRSLSTIVVERLLDVVTLLLFLVVLVPFVDIPSRARWSAGFLAVAATVACLALILLSRHREISIRWISSIFRIAPERAREKLTDMAQSALDGFAVLSNPSVAFELVAWSVVTWLSMSGVVFLALQAFSLDVGFAAAVFLVIVTTFGFFIPATPGSIGVYDGIVIAALTKVFDVPNEAAVSYALIIHLVFYLVPMLFGFVFLWRERQIWQRTSFLAKLGSFRREQVEHATTS